MNCTAVKTHNMGESNNDYIFMEADFPDTAVDMGNQNRNNVALLKK